MYQKTRSPDMIVRTTDGAYIPRAPGNRDYDEFLKWEAEGNVIAELTVTLEEVKAAKEAEINSKAEKMATVLTAGYPEFEMKTWPQQESESLSWQADNAALTPMIDIMAQQRGIDRVLYLQKTITKVTMFRQACSKLVGQRQKYADMLAAATTVEAVQAIDPVYSLA